MISRKNLKPEKKPNNDKSWIYGIIVAFLAVVLVNVFYIFAAKKTWRGIISPDAYQIGLNYNKVLDQQKRQEYLHIKLSSSYNLKDKLFFLKLFDSKKKPIIGAKITVKFKQMLRQELDFTAFLEHKQPYTTNSKISDQSFYQAEIKFPAPGKWVAQYSILLPESFEIPTKAKTDSAANPRIYLASEELFIRF